MTYQDGTTRVETYAYDALNRLQSVTDNTNQITSYGYDVNGNRVSQSNSNGSSTLYAYDDLNRLIKVSHYNAQGVVINEFSYELDNTGRRTKLTESSGRASTYSYDNLYRLISESITDATNGSSETSFTYDKVGNRLTQTHNTVVTSYVYDDNDRISSETISSDVTTFSYDDNGNTLIKDVNGEQTRYSYDMRNRMVAMDATATNNGTQANYQYNIDGIRTSKTVNGQATHYLIDNTQAYAQVIAETDSLGSRLITYLYGDDLISQTDNNNTSNTYHYDGLGSTRSLSDDSGEQSDSYDYLAFGELQNQTGTTENNYLYTGEQFDGDLDQYYLRARYYDQNLGRMTQMDSWQGRQPEPISLNKYTYAASSPVHFVDPSGNTYNLPGVTASFRVLSTLGNRSMHYLGKTYSRALFGYNRKDLAQEVFGIVGEALMDEALAAYKEMLKEGRQGSAANKGTWAHSKFESRVKAMRSKWKKYNITLRVEEFRDSEGDRTARRAKDSLGLDVTVYYKGALVLAFDLKTGKGMSKKRRGRLKQHFNGVEVVEIMVTPRRGKK